LQHCLRFSCCRERTDLVSPAAPAQMLVLMAGSFSTARGERKSYLHRFGRQLGIAMPSWCTLSHGFQCKDSMVEVQSKIAWSPRLSDGGSNVTAAATARQEDSSNELTMAVSTIFQRLESLVSGWFTQSLLQTSSTLSAHRRTFLLPSRGISPQRATNSSYVIVPPLSSSSASKTMSAERS